MDDTTRKSLRKLTSATSRSREYIENGRCSLTLSDEEIESLVKKYRDGDDDAGWRLVRSQRNWLTTLIRRQRMPDGIDPDDLLSELSVELFKAMKLYDLAKGKLSTFTGVIFTRRFSRLLGRLRPLPQSDFSSDEECEPDDPRLPELDRSLHRYMIHNPVGALALAMHFTGRNSQAIANWIDRKYPEFFGKSRSPNVRSKAVTDLVKEGLRWLGQDMEL